MRTIKLTALCIVCTCVLLVVGCGPEMQDLRIQNNTQRKRIAVLESQLQANKLSLDQMQRKLSASKSKENIEIDALQQRIDALGEDINKKKSLLAAMQQQLLYGGAQLPVELSTLLEDFANREKMVTYDAARSLVKFKSDLLFERGSDKVASGAKKAVKSLCSILSSDQASKFDIIIAGHTDDMRISRPSTRQKHPTNWHLSAHRAISVLNIMSANKVSPERLSVRGFGEFRPIAKNKPGKKGSAQNRRVEIYIVPKGI